MARKLPAKRASRPNPREERNYPSHTYPSPHEDVRFHKTRKIEIIPRNLAQESYLDALMDEDKIIVIATGPAGTGKSLLATLYAIKSLNEGLFKKIIVTRPTVSTGEDIGFLPGDLLQKLTPWSVPILDIFKEVYSPAALEKLIRDEVVEIAPLGMMRGRTLKNAIIICDEMQNSLIAQMRMLLTRIGDNSRMIVTGDMRQHDRGFEANGLQDFIKRLRAHHGRSRAIEVCEFSPNDVERHPVIGDVLSIYGEE